MALKFDPTKNHTPVKTPKSTKTIIQAKVFDDPNDLEPRGSIWDDDIQEQTQEKLKVEPKTNLGQTQDKPRTEPKTNLGQTQDKPRTELNSKKKTQDKPRTEPRTEPKTNLGQTKDKPKTKITFSSLVGLQRSIPLFIFQCCQFVGAKITEPLSIECITASCKSTKSSTQKTIQRLEQKAILIRGEYKNGRGGWTKYMLPDSIFQEILRFETQDKLRTNLGQTQDKPRTEPRTELKTTLSSSRGISSSDLNLLQTEKKQMSQEWLDLDWKSLSSMGLQLYHIRQIFDAGLVSAEDVEESIHHMHHDLTSGGKHGLKNPLAVFMKQLKVKGERYTVSTPGFISDEMRYEKKRLEEMQRQQGELEFIKTQQQEILNRDCVEKENEEFQAWMSMKTPEELKALAGNFNIQLPSGQGMLKNAYREEKAFIRDQISKELPT